jgi:hypothetical protein
MSPNMINQSATLPPRVQATEGDRSAAMQDFTGREAALAAQMRGGREQMMQAMPQGRTVGDQYLAPNWAESLSGAVSKGMGAYEMGQARQGRKGLEQARERKVAGQGAVPDEARYNEQMKQDTTDQRNAALDDRSERKLQQRIDSDLLQTKLAAEAERVRVKERGEDNTSKNAHQLAMEEAAMLRARASMIRANGGVDPAADKLSEEDMTPAQIASKGRRSVIDAMATGGERDSANLMVSAAKQFSDLIPQGQKMVAEGTDYSLLAEYAGDAAKMFTPKFLEDAAANSAISAAYTPEQLAWVGNIGNAFADLRKARTGANVTAIETELFRNFDPTVKGITTEQRTARMSEMFDFMNSNLDDKGIEGFTFDQYKPIPVEGSGNPAEAGGKDYANMTTEQLLEERRRRGR